jgi:PIN domain nuclease of toxin-antitoxin system
VILLDTHAWVWWAVSSPSLSTKAQRAMAEEGELGVVVVSCWEVAMLVEKRRLQFDRDVRLWVHDALARPGMVLLELPADAAVAAARLPGFHGDPVDRMIAATALSLGCSVVTKDRRLRSYRPLRTVW